MNTISKIFFGLLISFFALSCKKSDSPPQNVCCGRISESQTFIYNDTLYSIPNVFTPNQDVFFDTWAIYGLDNYPNMKLRVYHNRKLVHKQSGNYVPWDGGIYFSNDDDAEYYGKVGERNSSVYCTYELDLGDGSKIIKGSVCVLFHIDLPFENYGCTDGCIPNPDSIGGTFDPTLHPCD